MSHLTVTYYQRWLKTHHMLPPEAFPTSVCGSAKKSNKHFLPSSATAQMFFQLLPTKHMPFLSHSQYISTTCFEAAVYNNPPPCHNPFKRTKKKAVVPEDYFFKSLEMFCFGIARYLHISRQIHDPIPTSNVSLSTRSSPMHYHGLIWEKNWGIHNNISAHHLF